MPGTRCGGFRSSVATSGVERHLALARLLEQQPAAAPPVYITTITSAPSASGIQPPSNTLSRLAPRNVRSISRNGAISATAAHSGQRQTFQITMNAISAVTTIVPVTAMP